MSNIYDDFLRRMNVYRKRLGLTQSEFGELVGVSQSVMSKLELGKIGISYEYLMGMVKAGLDIDYLIIEKESLKWKNSITDFLNINVDVMWYDIGEVVIWSLGEMLQQEGEFQNTDVCCEFKLLKRMILEKTNGTLLWELRSMLGFSQSVMADKIGVNIKKYRSLERENTYLDAELLMNIYEFSSCRPYLFFSKKDLKMDLLNDLWNRLCEEKQEKAVAFLKQAIELRKR